MSGPIASRTMHALDVGRRIAAHLDLDRRETFGHQLAGPRSGMLGLVGAHAESAADRQRPAGSAQEFEDRLAHRFALNVPAGHFQGRLGKPIVSASAVHSPVDFADVRGIAADQLRRQHALDQRLGPPNGLAAPARHDRRLARSFDPRIRQHAHQHIARNRMLPERADHPPLGLDGNANRIGFDVRDFHGSCTAPGPRFFVINNHKTPPQPPAPPRVKKKDKKKTPHHQPPRGGGGGFSGGRGGRSLDALRAEKTRRRRILGMDRRPFRLRIGQRAEHAHGFT